MSDNKGQDWLDDTTAERLLRGAAGNGTAGAARTDPRAVALARMLAAAAAPATVDPAREEEALAAFREARDGGPELPSVAGGREAGDGGRVAGDWRPDGPESRTARAFSGTLLATAAVAGVALAAAAGVLPVLLRGADEAPAPVHTQGAAPQATGGTRPATPAVSPGEPVPSRSSRGLPAGTVPGAGVVPGAPGASRAAAPHRGEAIGPTALCRAYAAAGWRRGKTDEQIWKQLRKAAGGGGQPAVRRYCATVLATHVRRGGEANKDGAKDGARDSAKDGAKDDGPGRRHHVGGGNGKNRSGAHHRPGERRPARPGGQ
ncbi:hypothetical protein [Streptomyces sp. MI02-7b]|uniref:hypothetical protein n=1 Tax=Streptomyces sp. MI02-7b TaxID=462941 RepID=UPI0029BAEFC8|nr:hypothetical protein [Streptomyces sp. MI02-7b]MDX3071950.1 hypothetical protein [Streptomyces sp. MI02-7b]